MEKNLIRGADTDLGFNEFLESTSDAFYAVDSNWKLTYLNRKAEQYWKRSREEILGTFIWDMFPGYERTIGYQEHCRAMLKRIPAHFEMFSPKLFTWVEIHVYPLSNGGLLVNFRDIMQRKQIEEKLQFQANFLSKVRDAVAVADCQYRVIYWNSMSEKLFGWTEEDAMGRTAAELLHTRELNPTRAAELNELLLTGYYEGELIASHKDGSELYVDVRSEVIRDSRDEFFGIISSYRDITDRVRREKNSVFISEINDILNRHYSSRELMHKVGEKLKKYFRVSRITFLEVHETEDRLTEVYDYDVGTPVISYTNLTLSDYFPEKWIQEMRSRRGAVIYDLTREPCCTCYQAILQSRQICSLLISPFVKQGQVCFQMILQQKEARKWRADELELLEALSEKIYPQILWARTEEALRLSEEKYRKIVTTAHEGIWLTDTRGRIEFVNETMARWLGYPEEELKGKPACELVLREEPGAASRQRNHRYECANKKHDHKLKKKDGGYIWLIANCTSLTDIEGNYMGNLTMFTDITARKEEEKKLAFQSNLLNCVNDAIIAIDENIVIIFWNEMAEKLLGWKTEETLGMHAGLILQNFVSGLTGEEELYQRIKTDFYENEVVYKHKDGSRIMADIHTNVMKKPDGRLWGIVISARDVTERKKLEEELKFQKELFERVIENIPEPFAIYSKKGTLILENAAARNLYPPSGMMAQFNSAHQQADCFYMDGRKVSVDDLPVHRAMRGEVVRNEIIVTEFMGKQQISEFSAFPIYDKQGGLISCASFHKNITEAVQNQKLVVSQQEKMFRVEQDKIEALEKVIKMKDEFLTLISHEFKTPLTVIISAIQAMKLICRDELSAKASEFLYKILQNSNRQLKLVNNLLDITRINAGHFSINRANTDIVSLTRSITESIQVFAEQKGIRLTFSSTLTRKVVGIDEEKFERILLNLLSNAVKFTPKGKAVAVRVGRTLVRDTEWISVRVKDRGIGIPEDKQEMIFERFGQVDSSLSRQAEGTGIGLFLVRMLVELQGGEITLASRLGKGSEFSVLLPARKVMDTPEEKEQADHGNNRLINATSIEFSDVYM